MCRASRWLAARDRTPPTTPSNLRITASSANSVSLAWDASTDNSSNWWYCVQTGGGGCIRVDPPRTTLTRTFTLPDRTFTFTFSVYAVDAAGNRSGNSNTVSFTTAPDTTPPSPAPVISVSRLLPTRAVLSWPQPVDDFEQAPTAPTGLQASTPDGLDHELSWNASSDDTDPQSEIRYDVFVDGELAAVGLGTRTIVSCRSADPVEILVRAVDTSGNVSGPSNTVIFDDCNP